VRGGLAVVYGRGFSRGKMAVAVREESAAERECGAGVSRFLWRLGIAGGVLSGVCVCMGCVEC
jgi:hypothetical protein